MADIVIMPVYNRENLYSQMKASALEHSSGYTIEFCGIDNTNGAFPSAAKAYNTALDHWLAEKDNSQTAIIICHQDVIFFGDTIRRIYELCTENKRYYLVQQE